MSRFRWGLGLLLDLIALAAGLSALRTYVDHRLVLGAAAVVVLLVIAVVGFVSLLLARLRLAGDGMERARLARLDALRTAGADPDLEALARATAAEEGARAYLGRYFVAVTVLVGLVGTFAGLMETVRAVAPLLHDGQASALDVVAGPLAGLDVTFGASLVGILVTLALALVQGDLVLAEEQALAQLEERTRHEWVPARWPRAEAAAERAVLELKALRAELRGFVSASVEATATQVAAIIREQTGRLGEELGRVAASMAGEVGAASSRAAESAARSVEASSAAAVRASEAVHAQGERLAALVEEARARLGGELERAAGRASGAVADGAAAVTLLAEELAASARAGAERLAASAASVERAVLRAGDAFGASSAEASRAFGASSAEASRAFGASATEAARGLAAATGGSARAFAAAATEAARAFAAAAADAARALEGATATSAAAAREALGAATEATRAAVAGAAQASHEALLGATEATRAALAQATEASRATLAGHAAEGLAQERIFLASLDGALRSVNADQGVLVAELVAALRGAVEGGGARLEAAAARLEVAAVELGKGAGALAPAVGVLAPELGALAREVSLLAARTEGDEQALVLDEVARLGDGIERLEALLRMAESSPLP